MPILKNVTSRLVGIALLFGLALSACAPAVRPGCPGAINIGVSFTVDDLGAKSEMEEGYVQAKNEINQAGIGDGCQIELIYPKNQKSQAGDVQKDVQDLVDQGALAILAPQTNDGAVRAAQVSKYFNIPVVIPPGTADEISAAADNSWFFQINPKNSDIASAVFSQLKAGKPAATINMAIVFEHTDFGESAAAAVGEAALKNNVQIALYQRYSPFLSDFKEITEAIRTARPNLVYLISTQVKQAQAISQGLRSLQSAAPTALPSLTSSPSATATLKATQAATPRAGASSTPTQPRSATPLASAPAAPLVVDYVIGHGPAFTSREFLTAAAGNAALFPSNLLIAVPWSEDAAWPGNTLCAQVTPQAPLPAPGQPVVVRNVQAYISLKLVAAGLERLTQKTDWTVNEKKVSGWQEMLRDPANLAEFRRSLAQEIKKIQGCQFGSYLWPISFNSSGQNQITPLLVKISGGKLITVFPRK